MPTIKRQFTDALELYATDGYSGSDTDVGGTELFTAPLDLQVSGYEGAQIHLQYDASGTTDDLEVYVYASGDGTNFDDIAMFAQTFDNNASADTEATMILKDILFARLGMVRSGSTDTFDVKVTQRAWNWISE